MAARPAGGYRVVDHIVGTLAAHGVRHLFGVDGANIEDLYDAAHFDDDVTAVLAKHEFSAAAMADGYSRSGAGIGVVAATSGGGCLNTVAGLGESLASRVPVLALIGQASTALDGRGAFQDTSGANGALDALALFSTVSLFCRRITRAEDIRTALPQALAAAAAGGPAVLLLPKDVQQAALGRNGVETVTASRAAFRPVVHNLRTATGGRPGHDHRRRTGGQGRRPPAPGAAAGRAGRAGGHRSGRQGRHALLDRGVRCDGPPQRRRQGRAERRLPVGRHPG